MVSKLLLAVTKILTTSRNVSSFLPQYNKNSHMYLNFGFK